MLSNNRDAFLSLVRLGINHSAYDFPQTNDWKAIEVLASKHGLLAIIIDGVEHLPDNLRPPKKTLLQWIGEGLQNYEQRYVSYQKSIGRLAKFYNERGFRLMILKGYGLSLNYPKPNHRPCGDIDIWAFGQYKEADAAISKELSIKIDNEHHHHTFFQFGGFTVENHYDFLNVHYGHRNAELEKILKKLAEDDSVTTIIDGEKVYLPSANLHAFFVLRHALHIFAAAEMTLRQVLDWGFFVEKHTKEIDWEWLQSVLKEYHMMDFFNCLNAICVDDLGFDANIFPEVRYLPDTKERVLADVIAPKYGIESPRGFLKRVVFKCRRWHANAWKHDLCYGDSRIKSLFVGIWHHLLKPATI